ncbi:hypothetical protein SARC_05868 [Sphaeroforma arctica JP610]|uniref:Uncharacterized protein n=1 Tax=Sphaeroforma arctica JP610 TaxID=667725 RepID=A0A0L0FZ29_9EUKA|nr:hypothetical protein SARC_05868 [Sphaeroforma arctica JP610]KNC81831.1 hypothetical protein SARC_05868 [Sphaeroforma arctica JP610]|eukprot:XP_014155733.1 hypothetical protein SARC_05868 [Sphaeroforma arctica JP610]
MTIVQISSGDGGLYLERDFEGDTILDDYLTCPPVARLVNVYGINLPTEAGYAFRIQQGTLDSCLFTKYKLDKAFRTDTHKCVDGTLYENKHTVQKQRDGTRKCSGDGTVTYQSLSYPLNWEDNEKTTVENHEFEDMEHRAMLADPRLHEVLIKHVCKMSG